MAIKILKSFGYFVCVMSLSFFSYSAFAEDEHGHDHGKEEAKTPSKKHDEHSEKENGEHKEEGHGDHAGHDEGEEEGHGHGHEEESTKFGPGKAILAVKDEGKNFKLSPESMEFLKIGFEKVRSLPEKKNASTSFEVPLAALVSFQSKMGIFILEEGWLELVEVKIVNRTDKVAIIESKSIHDGDEIATKGVAFLRVAHLEASGQGGEGHAH